jgi:hypothetical protein
MTSSVPGTTAAAGEPQAWVWWAPGERENRPEILPKARLDSTVPLHAQAAIAKEPCL